MATRRLLKPALFICDLQVKFRPSIYEFASIVTTAQKMIRASQILNFPIYTTTQLASKLGPLVPELSLPASTVGPVDKTSFSMWVPEIKKQFPASEGPREIIVIGIEAHICVTQTALDLLQEGHRVYVLADGVSSCNKEEVPIALARLRHEGVRVTTSESWLYECVGDAGIAEFKQIAGLVKELSGNTKQTLETLCKI